jgi:hypothetical protein
MLGQMKIVGEELAGFLAGRSDGRAAPIAS